MVNPRNLVQAEIAEGATIADVARKVGYSRPSLSMYLAGRYPGGTEAIEAAIVEALGCRVACPGTGGREIAGHQCRDRTAQPMPTGNPAEFQAWLACRACPHNQDGGTPC